MSRWKEWLIRKLGGYVERQLTIKKIACRAQRVYSRVTFVPDPYDPDKFDDYIKGAIARNLIDELTRGGFIRYDTVREGNQATLTGCIHVVEQPEDDILTFERE